MITITKAQFFDPWLFCKVADQIRAALKVRTQNRRVNYDWQARYLSLRDELLNVGSLWETGV